MYETLLWNKFLETGMVEDYLRYTDSVKENCAARMDDTKRQDKRHAGVSDDDRYGSQGGTDRRI